MGSFIIIFTTIIAIIILGFRSIKNNRRIKNAISRNIKDINRTYKELFSQKRFIVKLTQGGMVLFAEFLAFVSIFTSTTQHLTMNFIPELEVLIKILIIICSFVIVHYSIGYILLISSRIHRFIYRVEDKNLKVDFILSYFITSTFMSVLVVSPEKFKENAAIGLIGVIICYYLNLKVLLTLMVNPNNIKSNKEDSTSFSRVIMAAILILIMLIFNLYLGVCFVNSLEPGAYLNATGNFDLFYYTIITFTTIGYGDIIPVTVAAKIIAILISITSVICLTVFLSSVMSSQDKIK